MASHRAIVFCTARCVQRSALAISLVAAPASACAKIKSRWRSDNSPPGIRLPEISALNDLILMELCGVAEDTYLVMFSANRFMA